MIEIWGKTQCPYCDMAKKTMKPMDMNLYINS